MSRGEPTIHPPEEVLKVLKDFQRDTVDYVFRRLYLDEPHARRFLVADEVGLGKTMVARGVIALTLEHLMAKEEEDRLDVIYVCSNGAIAQQNLQRLNVTGLENVSLPTRLSLLPLHVKDLEANRVNFVSLTPGTSFNRASRGGSVDERVLLWAMLRPYLPHWLHDGLANALQCTVGRDNWPRYLHAFEQEIDLALHRRFLDGLYDDPDLLERLKETCRRFGTYREYQDVPGDDSDLRYDVVAGLRDLVSLVSVHALKPNLIILDEFQRFRELLTGTDKAARLTREFLDYREPSGHHARTLLLSATPYRMMSLNHEDEDHYDDFLATCRFLFDEDPTAVDALHEELRAYRRALFLARQNGSGDAVSQARRAVQSRLQRVMVRTERIPESRDREAMLSTSHRRAELEAADLHQVRLVDRVARIVDAQDVIEYWKSAPYLLNFMGGYQMKRRFRDMAEAGAPDLDEALVEGNGALLGTDRMEGYKAIDLPNPRLRVLLEDTVGKGLWELLWMPPSQPYLEPGGPYRGKDENLTKALVFSTWSVVPDAIAALCSYEAERRMVTGDERELPSYRRLTEGVSSPLRFILREGRFTGQYSLMLFYPSPTLAALGDPLSRAEDGESLPVEPAVARARVRERIRSRLEGTGEQGRPAASPDPEEGEDQSWYWRHVAELDRGLDAGRWVQNRSGWERAVRKGGRDAGTGFRDHIRNFARAFSGDADEPTGSPPDDVLDVLTSLALGSPAVCALRALHRLVPELALDDHRLLGAASVVAQAFRTLFDLPESFLLLRSQDDRRYWERIAHYGIEGNLQAVLDEFAHVLVESEGLMDREPGEVVDGVARAMGEALSVRTSRVGADRIEPGDRRGGAVGIERFNVRTRFALRFGDLKDESENTLHRADTVRTAFNSPFRPFVLASTSVGQEGLDFHLYCHAVYHWNLPSNPVDLEQREGRVHRFKSHAVRKNIASRYGRELPEHHRGRGDPWAWMFARAVEDRPADANDLVPFWIFEDGPARVERRIPLIPLTREVSKIGRLVRSLAVYRMVFGQPRQEDLLALLEAGVGESGDGVSEEWQISLRPPGNGARPAGDAVSGSGTVEGPALLEWLPEPAELEEAPAELTYEDVWRGFAEALSAHDLPVAIPEPTGMNQIRFDFPRGRGCFGYSFNHQRMKFYWLVRGDDRPGLYRELMANRHEIQQEIAFEIEWRDEPGSGYGWAVAEWEYNPRDGESVEEGVARASRILRVMRDKMG